MGYMTDRKRALGLGSAKSGTEHFWQMQISSVALAILVPLFVIALGPVLGADHATAAAHLSRPFPALVIALTFLVGLVHFRHGAQVMIEDYSRGLARRALIVGVVCLSYGAIAVALFALARLAL